MESGRNGIMAMRRCTLRPARNHVTVPLEKAEAWSIILLSSLESTVARTYGWLGPGGENKGHVMWSPLEECTGRQLCHAELEHGIEILPGDKKIATRMDVPLSKPARERSPFSPRDYA